MSDTLRSSSKRIRPIALRVSNVSKSFVLPTEPAGSLKNLLYNAVRGVRGYRTQHVLNASVFEIAEGQFFGISGQERLWKIHSSQVDFADCTTPDSGSIEVNGKLVPFIKPRVASTLVDSTREHLP